MKVLTVGAGPAGLLCSLLMKKANPSNEIVIVDRRRVDEFPGWGVVLPPSGLSDLAQADETSYRELIPHVVGWNSITVDFGGERIPCFGHNLIALPRSTLLKVLQNRCIELGIELQFEFEVESPGKFTEFDLVLGADGANSNVRLAYADHFGAKLHSGSASYVWLGTSWTPENLTLAFRYIDGATFQAHAYPFSQKRGAFIVESTEESLRRVGLDDDDQRKTLAFCQALFSELLKGHELFSTGIPWKPFVSVRNETFAHQHIALIGDAAHAAHFSIGSGTKQALDDAMALAEAITIAPSIEAAIMKYEFSRLPLVERMQDAAEQSQTFFENVCHYRGLPPAQFSFNLLTRSGRLGYGDVQKRDSSFTRQLCQEFNVRADCPASAPMTIRDLYLSDRQLNYWRTPPPPMEAAEVLVPMDRRGDKKNLAGQLSRSTRNYIIRWDALKRFRNDPATTGLETGVVGVELPRSLVERKAFTMSTQNKTSSNSKFAFEKIAEPYASATASISQREFELLQVELPRLSFVAPFLNLDDPHSALSELLLVVAPEITRSVRIVWPDDKLLMVAINGEDCIGITRGGEILLDMARSLRDSGCDVITVKGAGEGANTVGRIRNRRDIQLSDYIRNTGNFVTAIDDQVATADQINTIIGAGLADLWIS